MSTLVPLPLLIPLLAAALSILVGRWRAAQRVISVAALTVYDMCKAVERGMRIEGIRLVAKSGGKSGDFTAE